MSRHGVRDTAPEPRPHAAFPERDERFEGLRLGQVDDDAPRAQLGHPPDRVAVDGHQRDPRLLPGTRAPACVRVEHDGEPARMPTEDQLARLGRADHQDLVDLLPGVELTNAHGGKP